MSKRAASFKLPLATLPVTKKPRVTSTAAVPDASSSSAIDSASSTSLLTTTATITASTTSSNTTPFSLPTYLSTLSPLPLLPSHPASELSLLSLECHTLDPSWLSLLHHEIRKPYFLALKSFLWKEGVKGSAKEEETKKVFPPAKDIYSWSRYTPLDKVRVVIIGQDPYHDDGQAHGLCFSVRPGIKIPPSLRNIYKELSSEYPSFAPPSHGNLTSLAKSGVLLLNTSLTVKAHQAGSHAKQGWEEFTDEVVRLVDLCGGSGEVGKESEGVVFLAWGAWAAKRVANLDKSKHLILTSAHPSPLSARRGFFGNDHFKKANEWLEQKYGKEGTIDWTSLPAEEEAVVVGASTTTKSGKEKVTKGKGGIKELFAKQEAKKKGEGAGWGVKTGFFFAGTGFLGLVLLWFTIPEIKGRSYLELDELFERKIPARHFASTKTSVDLAKETKKGGQVA